MTKEIDSGFIETKGVALLSQKLQCNRMIRTHFNVDDKLPLFDGFFNLLDQENNILKRFDVQAILIQP